MMYDAIKSFPEQFLFSPVVENKEKLGAYERFVVLGMGGSHLAADLIAAWKPSLPLAVHAGYGLPRISTLATSVLSPQGGQAKVVLRGLPHIPDEALKKTLMIASSYSGNTEETIDGFEEAGRRGIARAAIAVGGKLRDLARAEGVPFVQFPDTGIQPRSSIGFGIKALFALMGETEALAGIRGLPERLTSRMDECEKEGKALAEAMRGFVPVIYASDRNRAVAYNWKIKFNETGKIPAFYNVFPELNHNEMTGFDRTDTTRALSEKMFFVFLEDVADHPKVQKRMAITKELYGARAIKTASVKMTGGDAFEKMLSSTLIADWAAYHTARLYGVEANEIPMVDEFKKRIA